MKAILLILSTALLSSCYVGNVIGFDAQEYTDPYTSDFDSQIVSYIQEYGQPTFSYINDSANYARYTFNDSGETLTVHITFLTEENEYIFTEV